jgi:hypothetical protein
MASQGILIVNDYIKKFHDLTKEKRKIVNIDSPKELLFDHDKTGRMTVNGTSYVYISNNRKDPIDLLKVENDQFDRSYFPLEKAFSYQIMKPFLDQLKEQYPDIKVYADLKRIYGFSKTQLKAAKVDLFYNIKKQTINVMLRSF